MLQKPCIRTKHSYFYFRGTAGVGSDRVDLRSISSNWMFDMQTRVHRRFESYMPHFDS